MITAESYPIHVYDCPLCGKTHPITKETKEPFKGYLASYSTWTELCPETKEPIRISNLYFIDII